MSDNVLLLSIRPPHAEKIFSGEKTFEFRRVRPRVSAGDVVLVYVTGPVSALWGTFAAGEIAEGTPLSLWRRFGPKSGLSREALLSYFSGKETGYAIPVETPRRLSRDITLVEMADCGKGFRPPQSFRYLKGDDLAAIHRTARRRR